MNSIANPNSQNGAALLMSLIILAVISVMGIANIESSSLEMKLVNSQRERNIKFAVAESALNTAEEYLETTINPKMADFYTDSCSGSDCFESACNDGTCFQGVFEAGDSRYGCEVFDTRTTRTTYWEDQSLWETKAIDLGNVTIDGIEMTRNFIVEFLCFVDTPDDGAVFSSAEPNAGEPLFRVTVLVDDDGNRATAVMLQSTVMLDL